MRLVNTDDVEIWFVTGSQHLYGPETLKQVAVHSQTIAHALDASAAIPAKVVFKPVLTDPAAVRELCIEANSEQELCRSCAVDAHILAGKDVDWRPHAAAQARRSPAHAIQPGPALG